MRKKIRITEKVFRMCEQAIEDAVADSEKTGHRKGYSAYLKMHNFDVSNNWERHFDIRCEPDEIKELRERAEYEIEMCQEHIKGCEKEFRPHYMSELNAWRGLLRQLWLPANGENNAR
jgi:hypothetical protein